MSNECSCNRRAVVATLVGTGVALLGGMGAFAQSDPKGTRPQAGDVLVNAPGAKVNKPIMASENCGWFTASKGFSVYGFMGLGQFDYFNNTDSPYMYDLPDYGMVKSINKYLTLIVRR